MVRFWDFFVTLHVTRQVGPSGPQPLSISDIYALATMRGMDDEDDMDFILKAIPNLDQEYLKVHYEEVEKKQKAAAKAAKNKAPRGRNGR